MVNMGNISDKDLRDFCKWYKDRFNKVADGKGVVITCLCGHFHTYTKRAKELLKRCESINLLAVNNDVVFLK